MSRHLNSVAGRLSLRKPQRESLERLARILEIAPLRKGSDLQAAIEAIRSEFPTVTDFEREFPSLCFSLATGVGKTRLMGAFIAWLHLEHGNRNFFVLAPNLTIYNKLISDFTPNTSKYVFKGIAEFSVEPPEIITGENYESHAKLNLYPVRINIFNISKLNSEVRGGKEPRIKRFKEVLGESYFKHLSDQEDLVLLMDESHRYRASAGIRALNELNPVLGLEVTATPFTESPKGPVFFQNVVYDYPLARAMEDGFVKEPAVVTRENFTATGMPPEQVERIKLEDGIQLHERTKVELDTYSRETGLPTVKPFVLIIARDTTHAGQLIQTIQSDEFFGGQYKDKVIQVDSSRTGAEEDEMINRLLKVESAEELTEIVIHVNMLKEGWDVTNLYTIVPLRAANARTLIEQSIGRGLRLPYGKRTGVDSVDTLSIVAHDRFQEIIDEAKRPDSQIRMKQIVIPQTGLGPKAEIVVPRAKVDDAFGIPDPTPHLRVTDAPPAQPSVFRPEEKPIAAIARQVIRELAHKPELVPDASYLGKPEVQSWIVGEITARALPEQLILEGLQEKPNVAEVVAKAVQALEKHTISIPKVFEIPVGELKSGFNPFKLDLASMRFQPPSEDLWLQSLRTDERWVLSLGKTEDEEPRPENYVVRCLVDYDDISYEQHADLLYDLAGQVLSHLRVYLSEEDADKVMRFHQKDIAKNIYAQMHDHFWEDAHTQYEIVVSSGIEDLSPRIYTREAGKELLNFRVRPDNLSKISSYLFTGFERCLTDVEKFQSNAERMLAVILDRDSRKWVRPSKNRPRIQYRWQGKYPLYQPDFIAETDKAKYILEPKASNEMTDPEVLAKKEAAVRWCKLANEHAGKHGIKFWSYVLIPHDAIQENMTLKGLVERWTC